MVDARSDIEHFRCKLQPVACLVEQVNRVGLRTVLSVEVFFLFWKASLGGGRK
jgi:hypothetical protein